jgi:hypothetical protein
MQFHADIAFIGINRFSVDAQVSGNFLIARAVHPQCQHLLFLSGQQGAAAVGLSALAREINASLITVATSSRLAFFNSDDQTGNFPSQSVMPLSSPDCSKINGNRSLALSRKRAAENGEYPA